MGPGSRRCCALSPPLQMPFGIHALMQDAHDPNPLILGQVEHDVRLIVKPPQFRSEFLCATPLHRMFCKGLKPLVQAQKIAARLF